MNKKLFVVASVIALLLLPSCKKLTGATKVSATGTIYECLIVAPDACAGIVRETMEADMPCLPQMEPYFNTSHVSPAAFDDFLKPTRNIIIVDVNPDKYTTVKAKYYIDYWSHPQAVCRIQTPDRQSFSDYWQANGEFVREWFVRQELSRQVQFYKAYTDKSARSAIKTRFGCDMLVPEDYMLIKDTVDFLWCCNNKGPVRRDLVVYRYPYTDAETFTLDYLCAKRDEVLSHHISATVQGSYMGTEYKIFPPQMRSLSRLANDTADNIGFYAMEVRGLWKILSGEAMGGPFVSHTRLDQINGYIVTAEVYVLAPGQKKRNALRQAEAALYTLEMPQEILMRQK